jgi:hypothetical protein
MGIGFRQRIVQQELADFRRINRLQDSAPALGGE